MNVNKIKEPNQKTLKAFKEADKIMSGKTKTKKYKDVKNLRKDLGV